MNKRFAVAVGACLLLASGARVAATNATYVMDAIPTGLSNGKPIARVMLNVRRGGGGKGVSAIARVAGTYALVVVAGTPSLESLSTVEAPSEVPRQARFVRQVAQLSESAGAIDELWASFWTDCKVEPVSVDFGRVWFGLWEGRVQADYSTGQCRDLVDQIVAAGEIIKQDMAAAEEEARQTLTPADIRNIRRAYVMDWEGWQLPPPPRREP